MEGFANPRWQKETVKDTMKGFYSEAIKQRLFAAKSKMCLVLLENYHIVSDENGTSTTAFCGHLFDPKTSIKWDEIPKTTTLFCPECVRAFSQTFMQAKRMKYSEIVYTLQELAEIGFNPLALALVCMLVRKMEIRQKKRKHGLQKAHHKRTGKHSPNR